MSKDKHKGVERRKFVLANLPIQDPGKVKKIYGFRPDPSTTFRYRPTVDITRPLRELEKAGLVKRVRNLSFGSHVGRTMILAK